MKKAIFLAVILCLFVSLPAVEKIIRLGEHPFYRTNNLTPDDLKKIADKKAGEVKMGFEAAGYGELIFAFLEQIQKADIAETQIVPGDQFLWMLFKRGRQIEVKNDVMWAGKKNVPAYTFTIMREGKAYEFVIPKICANISLKSVKDLPTPVCSLKLSAEMVEVGQPVKIDVCETQNALKNTVTITDAAGAAYKVLELAGEQCSAEVTFDKAGSYTVTNLAEGAYGTKSANPCQVALKVLEFNNPPQCKLNVSKAKLPKGAKLVLDASESSDPDGQVVAATFEVKDSSGQVVETQTLTQPPFIYKLKTRTIGEYSVNLSVKDNGVLGGKSSACAGNNFTVSKNAFWVVDIGLATMKDPTRFLFLRAGYQHRFSEAFRLNALAGVFINLSDNSYGTPFVIDLIATNYFSKFFLGGGIGLWVVENDTKLDLIAELGYEIFSTKSVSGALFLEGRVGTGDFDVIDDMGRLGLGLRLTF